MIAGAVAGSGRETVKVVVVVVVLQVGGGAGGGGGMRTRVQNSGSGLEWCRIKQVDG